MNEQEQKYVQWWLENTTRPQSQVTGIDVKPVGSRSIGVKMHQNGGAQKRITTLKYFLKK